MEELFTGFFSKEPKTCQKGQNGIVQFRHVHNKKTTSHMVGDVSNSISASSLSHNDNWVVKLLKLFLSSQSKNIISLSQGFQQHQNLRSFVLKKGHARIITQVTIFFQKVVAIF